MIQWTALSRDECSRRSKVEIAFNCPKCTSMISVMRKMVGSKVSCPICKNYFKTPTVFDKPQIKRTCISCQKTNWIIADIVTCPVCHKTFDQVNGADGVDGNFHHHAHNGWNEGWGGFDQDQICFTCWYCEKRMAVGDDQVGKFTNCPHCYTLNKIPCIPPNPPEPEPLPESKIVACPDCQKEISKRAITCPYCGAPQPAMFDRDAVQYIRTKTAVFTGVLAVVALLAFFSMIAGCLNGCH